MINNNNNNNYPPPPPPHLPSLVLSRLLCDLQSFLLVLDLENLSYIAQAQRKSISELLSQLQGTDGPGKYTGISTSTLVLMLTAVLTEATWIFVVFSCIEDAEYMIMNCPSLSLSNEQINTPGTGESARTVSQAELPQFHKSHLCGSRC